MELNSQISHFYQLSRTQRIETLKKHHFLNSEQVKKLEKLLDPEIAQSITENQIAQFVLPEGVALNFSIDNKDYIIPMVTEEPSVIAACSHAAKLCRTLGGFTTISNKRQMMGQIIINQLDNRQKAIKILKENLSFLFKIANNAHPSIFKRGGGLKSIEFEEIGDEFLTLYLNIDTKEAMGANIINSILESLKEPIIKLTSGSIVMAILSNYPKETITKVQTKIPFENLAKTKNEGQQIAKKIVSATKYANLDPQRLATHNKGIMNGIEAVVLATGNDTRAVAASVYASSIRNKNPQSLTTWKIENDCLLGTIELSLPVGTVGGSINVLPMAKLNLEILQNPTALELASIIASVGLAQNLAALKALVSEGIQRGHMSLHAKNLAIQAGATGEQIEIVSQRLQAEGVMSTSKALEILKNIKKY